MRSLEVDLSRHPGRRHCALGRMAQEVSRHVVAAAVQGACGRIAQPGLIVDESAESTIAFRVTCRQPAVVGVEPAGSEEAAVGREDLP